MERHLPKPQKQAAGKALPKSAVLMRLNGRKAPKGRSASFMARLTSQPDLFLEGADLRGRWPRRFRDLCLSHVEALGGAKAITQVQRALLMRAAVLQVELERRDTRIAQEGGASDSALEVYRRTSETLARLLGKLGLDGQPAAPTAGRVNGRRRAGAYASDLELLDAEIARRG